MTGKEADMSTTLPATGVVGVSEGVPAEQLLGRLATYTLPDEERSGAQLMRVWAQNGLDVDDLPEARQPVHVFQSACASVNQRARGGANGRTEIRADEVDHNGTCTYQITLKVWDTANRVIEHEKAMRLTFNKQTNAITVDYLGHRDDRLEELEQRIRDNFDANAKTVPGQKIRNAIRATLLKIGAQNLRRKAGGLYFVPIELRTGHGGHELTKPVLDGLAGVLSDLYDDRADFYTIPLARDEAMQAMVRKHFVININDKARELTEKAIQRVRQGKGKRGVRSELVVNLINERRRIGGAVAQFEQLVAVEQHDIAANLRDLDRAITELQALADDV